MDAGDYDTNTLLVNNISSIAFSIYKPVATSSSPYTFHASDVECALRNDGHLVYMDAKRQGVWCFALVGKDSSNTGSFAEHLRLGHTLDVCGYHLQLDTQGAFEPTSLLKNRFHGANAVNTPSGSGSTGSALDPTARSAQSFNVPSGNFIPNGSMELDMRPALSPGIHQDSKNYASVPVTEMYEFFINSILSSLSAAFCRGCGAVSLTRRTLLLPPKILQPNDGEIPRWPPIAALATFRIYLTTAGSLVINLAVAAAEGMLSAADSLRLDLPWPSPSSSSILVAPLGHLVSAQPVLDRDMLVPENMSVQTPDTSQLVRYKPDFSDKLAQWKVLLHLHGISPSILEGCSWLNIQFPHDHRTDGNNFASQGPTVFVWPSVLCFRKRNRSTVAALDWQGKLMLERDEDFDPLNAAKDWFQNTAEREELFSKRRQKEQQELTKRDTVEVDGRSQRPNDTSPLALTRIGNAGPPGAAGAAAGTMYPTPPDGVQLPPGVTPSFDGTNSSPSNQPAVAASAENDNAMASDGQLAASFPGGWETDARREQTQSAFFESENMFGDLGEDLFENNELTDADFDNYFDQVDEVPSDGGLDMSALQDVAMNDAMDLSAKMNLEQSVSSTTYDSQAPTERQPVPSVSPVFTKPELKHARSTLGEENRQHQQTNAANYQANVAAGIKRRSSPFNPETVYKRVRASLSGPPVVRQVVTEQPPQRRNSVFEKVDFDPSLSLTNEKYQPSGQFQYNLPSPKDKDAASGKEQSLAIIPKTHQYSQKRHKPPPPSVQYGELIAKITTSLENNSLIRNSAKRDGLLLDEDDSLVSDQDDSSQGSGGPSSPTKSSVARTRLADDDNLSLVGSHKDYMDHVYATSVASPAYTVGDLSSLPQPGEPDVPVNMYFADPEPWPLLLSCSDEDLITVAQIITEQAASGSLVLGSGRSTDADIQETRRHVANAARHSMQCLRSVLPSSLSSATECLFKPFIDTQDVPVFGQQPRMQPRPVGQELARPNLFQIPAPHIELRRGESKLSVLPTAVSFWESLGLSPPQGTKDIWAMCVCPDWKGMPENATWFLDRIRSIYESLKMGTFEPTPASVGLGDGRVLYTVEKNAASPYSATTPRTGSALAGHMSKLAQDLSTLTVANRNFVVYIVYMPEQPSSIVEACAAFHELFEKYKRIMVDRKKAILNELVLQLIPLDYVASETSLAILTPADCIKLCLETYDRCTLFGGPMPAPAIVLEQALPTRIDFKWTTVPPAHVLHENSCIHIAYARSVDERWITAAWTDNRGSKQMTASYCMGRRGRPLSNTLDEITHEIWETTHDLISVWKVHWRVIVTKCGPMDQTEANHWLALAQNENKVSVSLTLLTVDTNPSLQLIPPVAKIPVTVPSAFYTTPVSTPGPTANVSPEQNGTASTPMGGQGSSVNAVTPGGEASATEPDADTTLVDVTDTTWGAVVSHRLNTSTSLTDLNPALQSGYLIKRSGTRPEDPPVAMEINVIHSESNNPRAYEAVLREMLNYFRGLGTLARSRGMVDRETDVRPWHVAAAEKGVRTLYQLM